ncbi:MAG: hypothetical protein ABR922_22815 [Streptosporangiaceae bacterium]|jgi:hypothetical protein
MRPADDASAAIKELQWHWGETYQITGAGGTWLARRVDNGHTLVAASAVGLRELIVQDYTADPVPKPGGPISSRPLPSADFEAAALRNAFPSYTISVIVRYGDKPRFEAVSRDGGNPYCLVSSNAREIWHELRRD